MSVLNRKNRRAAFTRARNFIRDKKYTKEEFQELKQIIEAHENDFKKQFAPFKPLFMECC